MKEHARLVAIMALFVVAGVVLWRVLGAEPVVEEPTSRIPSAIELVEDPGAQVAVDSANTPVRAPRVVDEAQAPLVETAASRIAGRAVSPDGAPVPGAEVLVHHPERKARRLRTDAQGTFIVDGLDDTTFTVRVTADRYNPAVRERIAPGGELLLVEMTHRSTVEGRVRDARTGEYLSEFDIVYLPHPPGDEKHWQNIVHHETTEWQRVDVDSGRYRLEDIFSDSEFALGARAEGYEAEYVTVDPIAPGATAEATELLLLPETRIVGTVYGPDGAPLGGATVALLEGQDERVVTQSDDTGAFEITGLGDGAVVVEGRHEGHVSTRVEVALSRGAEIPVELHLSHGASITGLVTLDDVPIAGVQVKASEIGSLNQPHSTSTVTDVAGSYTLTGLTPGDWYVFAEREQDAPFGVGQLSAQVSVSGQSVQQDFHFTTSLGAVEGAITFGDEPAESATVSVRPTEGRARRIQPGTFENGLYRVDELVPGNVQVQVEAMDRTGQTANALEIVEVLPGATTRFDFRLDPADAVVGRVIGGVPERTQLMILRGKRTLPPALSLEEALLLQHEMVKQAEVAADGRFEVSGLSKGDYTIVAVTTGDDADNFLENLQIQIVPFQAPSAEEVIVQFE